MKFLKLSSKSKRLGARRISPRSESIADYGKDQLQQLAKKGIGFQIVVL